MKVVGKTFNRGDGAAKARGEAIYGFDFLLPGTLHGVIVRSPVPSGRISNLDIKRASRMPGVRAVVTSSDVPDVRAGWVLRDQRLFAHELIRFEGEPVAALSADSLEQARAAADAIEMSIEPIEPVVDLVQAMSDNAPLIHPEWQSYVTANGEKYPRRGNIAGEIEFDPGGVDEAFAAAAQIIEDEYHVPRNYQSYLELKSAVAVYRHGRYEVHTAHQFPFNVQERIAQYLAIESSQVRVIGHAIGGGFGGKLDTGVEPYACVLSKASGGRPVRIACTRTEDILTCPSRENATTKVRTAIDAAGRMIGREVELLVDNGAYSGESPKLLNKSVHCAHGVYKVGPTRVSCKLIYTNTTPTGAFRGVFGVHMFHAIERHMDHIAATLGADRREYRLENLIEDGAVLLNGQALPNVGILLEGFNAVEDVAPWTQVSTRSKPLTGVGIGAAMWNTNPMAGSATVRLNLDGTVGVVTAANDNGSGALSLGVSQIVAEEMGLLPQDVHITMPDTDLAGYDGGSQGSRTTRIVGRAAATAADRVIQQMRSIASEIFEASPEDLVFSDGTVSVVGSPQPVLSYANVAKIALKKIGSIQATETHLDPLPEFNASLATDLIGSFPAPTYHVHLAEVEIDPVTGNVKVTRYVVAQDVGRAISPSGVYGQIAGGVAQGIGYALYESLRIDGRGRYVERSLESYRLPLALDIPDVEVQILEHPDDEGPFGAKGVGEPPILLPAAVIGNAVSDALGVPFDDIPITPEAVLRALIDNQELKQHRAKISATP